MNTKHSVGYFSAYYRGLECLLELWPRIRMAVPDATLDIYYGWGSWDTLEGANGKAFHDRIDQKLSELADQGVTEHGRVSHEELAKVMKATKVFAYTTEFPEISCITMMKVLAAGCYPVTTGVAALKETQGGFGTTVECANLYSNDYAKKKFVTAVVAALKDDSYDPEPARKWALDTYSWDNIATQWSDVINAKSS